MGSCVVKPRVYKRRPPNTISQWLSGDFVEWSRPETTGTPPSGRYAHSMAVFGDKIYVFGGYCGTFDDGIYIFDTVINHWDKLNTTGTSPGGIAYHSSCAVDKKLYIFGGYTGRSTLQDLYIFDTEDLSWSHPRTTGITPSARFEHSMVAVGKSIIVFGGGGTQTWLNDVSVLDTETLSWTTLLSVGLSPKGRCAHSLANYGSNKLFLYGGYDGTKSRLTDTYLFDTDSTTWTLLEHKNAHLHGRAAHTLASAGDTIYLFGGCDGKQVFNDIFMLKPVKNLRTRRSSSQSSNNNYNGNTNTCEKIEESRWMQPHISGTPPSGRSYHTSCIVNQKLYIFGGHDGVTRSDELFVLQHVVPTLLNQCVTWLLKNKTRLKIDLRALPLDIRELFE